MWILSYRQSIQLIQEVQNLKRALKYTDDVEFSPEDAGRSDPDFLFSLR